MDSFAKHPHTGRTRLSTLGGDRGSVFILYCVRAKDVENCTYCLYCIIDIHLEGMPWPKTVATHNHAHLGLLDIGREIKGLVVSAIVGRYLDLGDYQPSIEVSPFFV